MFFPSFYKKNINFLQSLINKTGKKENDEFFLTELGLEDSLSLFDNFISFC